MDRSVRDPHLPPMLQEHIPKQKLWRARRSPNPLEFTGELRGTIPSFLDLLQIDVGVSPSILCDGTVVNWEMNGTPPEPTCAIVSRSAFSATTSPRGSRWYCIHFHGHVVPVDVIFSKYIRRRLTEN